MRMLIVASFLLLADAATAEPVAVRPVAAAPSATAPFTQRASWCERYAAWIIQQVPQAGATPADVRPTQRFETEFDSCKPDPQLYERQTLAEIPRTTDARRS